MEQPFVSVVIPCYNAGGFVGDAINSALHQSYAPIEVIVIDDGSTDGSTDVLRSFGRSISWETGPNRGACVARNRGLELAKGRFVQFLDADDLLHAEKLARQIPTAVERYPEIVCCRWKSELSDGAFGHLICSNTTNRDPVVLAVIKSISTPAPLYPKELLHKIGGWRAGLPCAQDFDLNLRLACAGASFYELNDVLITVRRTPGGVSSNMVRVLDQFGEICWRARRQLEEQGTLTETRAAAFAAAFANHARMYLRYNQIAKAKARFAEAYEMHPSGGIDAAYRPGTRLLRRIVGPLATERIVQAKRRLARQSVLRRNVGD